MRLSVEAQAIWDKAFEVLRHVRVKSMHFEARPRYTCGSGALVDERVCCQCAADEVRFRDYDLQGIHGEERKARAEKLGLSWICYARWEKGKKVYRYDLITGETILEPKRLEWEELVEWKSLRRHIEVFGDTLQLKDKMRLAQLELRGSMHRQEPAK